MGTCACDMLWPAFGDRAILGLIFSTHFHNFNMPVTQSGPNAAASFNDYNDVRGDQYITIVYSGCHCA